MTGPEEAGAQPGPGEGGSSSPLGTIGRPAAGASVPAGAIGQAAVRLAGVVKRFGEVEAVAGVDLEVHAGEFF